MSSVPVKSSDVLHGYSILHFDTLDSTSSEAKRLIQSGGDIKKTVICAHTQTKGHGRYGRQWQSPPGNVYASFIIPVDKPLDIVAQLSFVAAVAVGKTLAVVLPDSGEVTYKWPNDVLIQDRKIAGILLESSSPADISQTSSVIVGIGINIKETPQAINKPSTCLNEVANDITNLPDNPVDHITKSLITYFSEQQCLWETNGFQPIQEAWMQRVWNYNKPVVVKSGKSLIKGICKGINIKGELVLDSTKGKLPPISTGEVFWGNEELSVDYVAGD